jgi:2-dehydropantoate 2-reductase
MPSPSRPSPRSYAILGTGAIGGYYGGLLARAGFDTRFLLRSDFDHVAKHGLRVDTPEGGFELDRVHAYADPQDMPRSDVAVVCLKATQNDALGDLLPRVLKPGGVVVLLQNGLNGERRVASLVPEHDVVGGLCFVCVNKLGPGHVRYFDYGRVKLGIYDRDGDDQPMGITPPLDAIAGDFTAAGIDAEPVEDLVRARWQKLMWNVPFNGLSVVLRTTTDELIGHAGSLALCRELIREVGEGCETATGRTIDEAFREKMIEDTRKMTPYRTSMLLDFEADRPMEVEAIFGEPLRDAGAAGAKLPRLQTLYRQLSFLNDTRHNVPTTE